MAENSKIEWTTHTFNPWRGCTKVHTGCTNCYAEQLSGRNPKTLGTWGPNGTRVVASEAMWREPLKWNKAAEKAGERHRVFCASLADVFEDWTGPIIDSNGLTVHSGKAWYDDRYFVGKDIHVGKSVAKLDDVRRRLFDLIDDTPSLDWLLLTKRPENVRRMWPAIIGDRRENVWIGTSVSDQETADAAMGELAACRHLSPVLFLSAEPLVGHVDLGLKDLCNDGNEVHLRCEYARRKNLPPAFDWVITGGESGPKARECNVAWIRSVVEQCKAADVACFVKQLGSHAVDCAGKYAKWPWPGEINNAYAMQAIDVKDSKGGDWNEWPSDLRVRQFPVAAIV